MRYPFSNKWCPENCPPNDEFINRGTCELTQDPEFLVYLHKGLPKTLPSNLVGEVFNLTDTSKLDSETKESKKEPKEAEKKDE